MTQQEAQQRNWQIRTLMGQLPRLGRLIPADIKAKLPTEELTQFLTFAEVLLEILQEAKVKRFTCGTCHPHGKNPTKNRKAYKCEFCGTLEEPLYNIKD